MKAGLLNLFPKGLKRLFFATAAKYPVLADGWYLLTGGFRSEHAAVLGAYGCFRYENDIESCFYEFVVRIHGLEKGFVMPNRRSVWAKQHVQRIVDLYGILKQGCRLEWKETLVWATCVMNKYFQTVSMDETVKAAHTRFERLRMYIDPKNGNWHPSPIPTGLRPTISIVDLIQFSQSRHSIRVFENRQVEKVVIDRAIMVARQAPSACNRQGFQFHIADNPERAGELGSLALGGKGLHHQFPALAVLIGKHVAYPLLRDRHAMYIDASLAAMGFLLGLHSQGVGSCCLAWPLLDDRNRKMARS